MGEHIFLRRTFMKTKFLTGMAVLLSASLFFTGCPMDGGGDDNGGNKNKGPVVVSVFGLAFAAPVTGIAPVKEITATAQYTGSVVWSPAVTDAFAADTAYTATVTLKAKTGYTFNGVAKIAFTYTGADATNLANRGVVTVVFAKTGGTAEKPTTVNALELKDFFAAPKTGEKADTQFTGTQYDGAIAWSPAVTDTFAAGTAYTATVTLKVKNNTFTFDGVAKNAFTYTGATATNPANSGVVTVVFAKTGETVEKPTAVNGEALKLTTLVTKPVTDAAPKTDAIDETQYTGSVEWQNSDSTAFNGVAFAAGTAYKAVVTLTAKDGYTFTGVPANAFSHADADTTVATPVANAADSGTVTITFPATTPWYDGLGNNLSEAANTVTLTAADTTLTKAVTVPNGKTLKIGAGAKLTVPAGQTLTLTGTLVGTGATSKLELGVGVTVGSLKTGTYVWHNASWFGETAYKAAVAAAAGLVTALTTTSAEVDASDLTIVNLKGNATVNSQGTATVGADVTLVTGTHKLTVASGGTLSVEGALRTAGTVEVAGTLTVAGAIDVENGGTLTLAASNTDSDLKGTIHVKSGGTSKDLKPGGGSVWKNAGGTGKFVFDMGAKAYVGGDAAENLLIGTAADTASAVILLKSGTFSNTRAAYELEGNATLNKTFEISGSQIFTIKDGKLTVELTVATPNASTEGLLVTDANAKIVGTGTAAVEVKSPSGGVQGGLLYFSKGGVSNFYDAKGVLITDTPPIAISTGIYDWNAALNTNAGGWKAAAVPIP
jgi:hypothetical protein